MKLFHSFRRTAARDKRAAGVDTSVIMEVQGWESDAMFRRYAITTRQDKLESLQKLEQFEAETRTKAAQNAMSHKSGKEQVQ